MTDFQVGDRVSVEGVVTHVFRDAVLFKPDSSEVGGWSFPKDCLTLVERPKRTLRVGSVWEHNGSCRYVYLGGDRFSDWRPESETVARDELNIDISPALWREVPVEELEAEARA